MNYSHPPDKQHYNDQVWTTARQIPRGKVATYGQLAKMIPVPEGVSEDDYRTSAARWVGLAMAACPNDVPWHRVVNSQGKISHQAGAAEQKKLLEAEGIFLTNKKINLNVYQWSDQGSPVENKQGELF